MVLREVNSYHTMQPDIDNLDYIINEEYHASLAFDTKLQLDRLPCKSHDDYTSHGRHPW